MIHLRAQLLLLLMVGLMTVRCAETPDRQWLAGDSHIHSHWSAGYDRSRNPPVLMKGRDAIYPTPLNVQMARRYGLSWMVTTDHGGPNHAKFNMTQAYGELQRSRRAVRDVLQFYGMELNMPGMDHHTLIIPNAADEWSVLFEVENRFDANEVWPRDPARDTQAARRTALDYLKTLPRLPLLVANHPSRSATGIGQYGRDEPWELRGNNDRAPAVYRGMEGAPGHQAATLASNGEPRRDAFGQLTGGRGAYRTPGAHTLGGFDQMTAIVGGLWDSMLGEGRRFWIVATSDSHVHYTETARSGNDFWPGEFHKTYVHARKTYEDVLDALRGGRIFVVAGDLITELDVVAAAAGRSAQIGGTLQVDARASVDVTIRFHDPETRNENGDNPKVNRIDVIRGDVRGPVSHWDADRNETTRVMARFTDQEWSRSGDVYSVTTTLPAVDRSVYIRVRGTSTADVEPLMDEPGENPWADLWFYSNPIFIVVE